MRTRFLLNVVAGLPLFLGSAVPAAAAQAPCTLQTFVGTYAFSQKGSSTILSPTSAPYPLHWAGGLAPFVTIGEVTFGANGVGKGFYWIRIGSFNAGADPVPVEVTITELNADCTGKWQFPFTLLGAADLIEERFVAYDNGREVRSIPTATGVPTLAWIGEMHRISKPGEVLSTCGPQTINGKYLATVENLLPIPDTPNSPLFRNAMLIRTDVSMSGDFTGTLYEKLGPVPNIELPVWGTTTVNPDCSYNQTLNFEVHGIPRTAAIRGVYFNEGKEYYGFAMDSNMGIVYSFGHGERIGH